MKQAIPLIALSALLTTPALAVENASSAPQSDESGTASANFVAEPPLADRASSDEIITRPILLAQQSPTVMRRDMLRPSIRTSRTNAPPIGRINAVTGTSLADAIIMREDSYTNISRLPNVAMLPSAALRANPRIVIGKTTVDFSPILANPKALINIAARLRAVPNLIAIDETDDALQTLVIPQRGIAIRSVLKYRLLPGACLTASSRAQVAATGVNCFVKSSEAQRATDFATPGAARYVADTAQRAQMMATARTQIAAISADTAQKVAAFRAQLSDPTQSAALAAQIGPSELARLQASDDEALENELLNTQENEVEQVAFVPDASAQGDAGSADLGQTATTAPQSVPDANVAYDIGTFTFLTGFTLGKEYEYRQKVTTTIKWCLLGCKETYYAEVYAGFGYGFGLRFPIQLGGDYVFNRQNGTQTASLRPRLVPINGSADQFRATGLSEDLIFDGQELVAFVSAKAGGSAKLPVVGTLGPIDGEDGEVKLDFTSLLPAPFTNGQMTPPAPGGNSPETPFVLDTFDLIGGRLNFGVFGGQLFPAVKIGLESNELTMTLVDKVTNATTTLSATNLAPIPLGVDQSDASSSFKIENPVYNLAFVITPGLTARLFVDVGVWGNNWDFPVWFPQLSIKLPPNGANFPCHDGTICSRDFRFTPAGAQTEFIGKLNAWAREFDAKWTPECFDQTCKDAIAQLRDQTVADGKNQEAAAPGMLIDAFTPTLQIASATGRTRVVDSIYRKAGDYAAANSQIAIAVWTPQCSDTPCRETIATLAAEMGPAARDRPRAPPVRIPGARAADAPLPTPLGISQAVNGEYTGKFGKEVADSKLRFAAAQLQDMRRQMPNMPTLPGATQPSLPPGMPRPIPMPRPR